MFQLLSRWVVSFAFLLLGVAATAQGLVVRTMPGYPNAPRLNPQQRHPVRPGVNTVVWGNADLQSTTGFTFAWTLSANPNVNVVDVTARSGPVTDARFIHTVFQFQLLNGSTKENLTATLVVDNGQGTSGTKTVGIVIIDPADPSSDEPLEAQAIDVDIAIADGLRWLYLHQSATTGSWNDARSAETAYAVWAFQNQGHLPTNDANDDIYVDTVRRGLNYVLGRAVVRTDITAPRADVARGAIANGVSDWNNNQRTIELAPGSNSGYETPIACAALVASAAPDYVVNLGGTSPLNGLTFREVVEDVVDWIGASMNAGGNTGIGSDWRGRGGFDYNPADNLTRSDMSINSWVFVALEGIQEVFRLRVPDWIKQEIEYCLIAQQTARTGDPNQLRTFGYTTAVPYGSYSPLAVTGGGLSGLALVETAGPLVTPGQIILNQNDSIEYKRTGALLQMGASWNDTRTGSYGSGSRGNPYVMWTAARALRLTARARGIPDGTNLQLLHGGVLFDWATGEENASGQIAAAGTAREGYFTYLLRNRDTTNSNVRERGVFPFNSWYGNNLTTAMSVLVLTPRVFTEPCPGQIVIDVTQLQPPRDSQLPVGADVLLTGRAEAQSASRPLAAVLVNGEPVDSLDVSGRFFKRVRLEEGENLFDITSIERCGQSTTTHRLFGVVGGSLPFDNLTDLTTSVELRYRNTSFNRDQSTLLIDAQACNRGNFPIDAPLLLVIDRFSSPSLLALNPDGYWAEGQPYFVFVAGQGSSLQPAACSAPRRILIHNPQRERVDFTATWMALGNTAPYFVSAPPAYGGANQAWLYDADARDGEGHAITYGLVIAPTGMTIDPATGQVTWVPDPGQQGLHQVVLSATDTRGAVGRQEFTIDATTSTRNRPPSFVTAPVTRASIGVTYRYAARGSDPDGDPLTFALSTAPAGMSIDPTGNLVWPFPLPGDHPVALVVRDGRGGEALQQWLLSAGSQPTNPNAPLLYGSPGTSAALNAIYVHQAFAVDPDPGQTLTFSLVRSPVGMQLDSRTGRITWRPGGSQVGINPVQLRVSDGAGGAAEQQWDITVTADPGNRPPVFLSIPPLRGEVGQLYQYIALAEDPDTEIVTFVLVQGPNGMTVDPVTGRVTWTPTATGRFPVALRADDRGGMFGAQAFEIVVGPANQAPSITSSPTASTAVGGTYRYQVNAFDPDSDPLQFALVTAPSGMTVHPLGGLISWTPSATGSAPVEVEVTDGRGGRATQQFVVQVTADTTPPDVVIQAPTTQVPIQQPVRIRVGATDNIAVTAIELDIDGVPQALDLSGWATFTPTAARSYALLARARDAAGNVGTRPLQLTAFDPRTGAPGITLGSPAPGSEITAPVDITGSIAPAQAGNPITWAVRAVRNLTGDVRLLGSGNAPVTNGLLARLDPTLLPNGSYRIEISATENNVQRTFDFTLGVAGDLKLGNYSFSVTDLNMPVAGIPIVLQRSYDSLDTSVQDFGRGWRLQLPGRVEDSAAELGNRPAPFVANERVYVTGLDGRRVGFTFRPESIGGPFAFFLRPKFEPDQGVDDRLELTEETFVVASGGQFFNLFEPFNPTRYRYITRQGVKFTIDEVHGLQLVEDAFGNTLTVTRDGLLSSTGVAVQFTRDSQGRITRIQTGCTDADLASTIQGNDATVGGKYQLGTPTELVYDYTLNGNLEAFQDQMGNRTTYGYEEPLYPHYLTRISDPLGRPIVRNVYGPDGRIVASCGPDGNPGTLQGCQRFTFDPTSRIQTITTGNGHLIAYQTDERGNVLLLRRFLPGNQTLDESWVYDRNRPVRRTLPSGASILMVRDALGNLIAQEDANGGRWTYTYDGGKLRQQCSPLGDCYSLFYNSNGAVERIQGPLGTARNWSYDAFGRMTEFRDYATAGSASTWRYAYPDAVRTRITHPDGGIETLEVDPQGLAVGRTRRDGGRIGYERRADGRLQRETWPDGTVFTHGYDAAGNLTSVTDGRYEVRRTYTVLGQLATETTLRLGVPIGSFALTYDANGNVTRITDSFGGLTVWQYDPRDLPTSMLLTSSQGNRELRWFHDADGRIERTEWRLPGTNTLVATTHSTYACASCGSALAGLSLRDASNAAIYDLFIQRRADLSVAGVRHDSQGTDYVHDAQNRLLAASRAGQLAEWFGYDAAGNRQQDRTGNLTYAGNAPNRLLTTPNHTFAYDLNGNVTTITDRTTAATVTLRYDARGRCTAVVQRDGGGAVLQDIGYEYDGLDRRVARTRNGSREFTLHLGQNPMLVVDATQQVVERRLYGRGYDELFGFFDRQGQFRWVLRDHVGSVVAHVRDDGSLAERFSYGVFGELLARLGPAPANGSEELRFGARPFEVGIDIGHYRRRMYFPATGRFLSEDPMAPFGYAYGENAPALMRDPTGRTALVEYACLAANGALTAANIGVAMLSAWAYAQHVVQAFEYAINAGDPNIALGAMGSYLPGLLCNVFLNAHVTWAVAGLSCGTQVAVGAFTLALGFFCPGADGWDPFRLRF